MRRTRIIATIGPASDSPGTLDALIAAGLDVARLNASHLDQPGLERTLRAVRDAEARAGVIIGVMLDLPGPKLRVGEVTPGTMLRSGAPFDICADHCTADELHACVTYDGLWRDVSEGDRILIDDGRLVLGVTAVAPGRVSTTVVTGGELRSHKGLNVPGVRLSLEAVTPEDMALAEWGRLAGVDFVAQSFVRSASDIVTLRAVLGQDGPLVVAKVEKHEAVQAIDEIIEAADAVMVARGDLGVEMPVESVPVLQRRIVEACRRVGRPVVVATQMLESMTNAASPTRAEASDVATAIFEGADAVMLSGETAVGDYPVQVVQTMSRIAEAAEAIGASPVAAAEGRSLDVSAAVSAAVVTLAANLDVTAIVTSTRSGATARSVAARRPDVPIVAPTTEICTARQLAIVWGVIPTVVPAVSELEETFELGVAAARRAGLACEGQLLALTAGVGVGRAGATDLIRVIRA